MKCFHKLLSSVKWLVAEYHTTHKYTVLILFAAECLPVEMLDFRYSLESGIGGLGWW